ncbi:hypothetical protein WKR88_15025 [Trinickia caryophylli]|uniref:Dioxygenase n=1 Tax=Trinickia caryophylli TaxID=28094 RepID=A0A1X7D7U3_TRICW|nr:hypothetical protein [Trinickia caryophylli]PMS12656.1 hypothetical protein C0Z17_07415 [Trinickia caryophylli]TRX15062.1 hypothetical protein FNF07_28095 [Trinickia caryophylli]WQE14920.1 hypothetical protein U0034_20420 [Trinickia caryophylli]SMF10122.1 hypothetical protein SAMN06295900_102479 [Trinickia caryophylli]GLU31352.1 hypothetical protein Busp01_11940 [Trinickia caryophylli]
MTFNGYATRRRFLLTTLVLGAALDTPRLPRAAPSAAAGAGACESSPEQETGPYHLDTTLFRADVTEGKPGIPLLLTISLIDKRRCAPLAGAIIDIWQCDALGNYSGFTNAAGRPPGPPPGMPPQDEGEPRPGAGPGPGPGVRRQDAVPPEPPPGQPPRPHPSDRLTFLRGIQRTDERGNVTFRTIVPGCYEGRTNHIHFKVRTTNRSLAGEHISHTGQIFFPEGLMVQLMRADPYRSHAIARTTQTEDPVFVHQQGTGAIARTTAMDGSTYENGLRAQAIAVVDPDATPVPVAEMPAPRPRRF